MQALKLFMGKLKECSESKSWFNNNQSHYFKQFLYVTHKPEGKVSTTREHSLYIPHQNQYCSIQLVS